MFLGSYFPRQAIQGLLDDHACQREPSCMRIEDRAGHRLDSVIMSMSMIVRYGGWTVGVKHLEQRRWDATR